MAISLEIGVSHLFSELAANTLGILVSLQSAGAISTLLLESFLYRFDNVGILVQTNSQNHHSFYTISSVRFILPYLFPFFKYFNIKPAPFLGVENLVG